MSTKVAPSKTRMLRSYATRSTLLPRWPEPCMSSMSPRISPLCLAGAERPGQEELPLFWVLLQATLTTIPATYLKYLPGALSVADSAWELHADISLDHSRPKSVVTALACQFYDRSYHWRSRIPCHAILPGVGVIHQATKSFMNASGRR